MAIFDRLFGRRKKEEGRTEEAPTPETPAGEAPPAAAPSEATAPQAAPVEAAPVETPAAEAPSAPAPAPQPAPAFRTNESHLDGWEPSPTPAEALTRFRSAPQGLKAERARRELGRHMISTPYYTVLGPGGDGRPTVKAAVVNSERLLTVYTTREAAEGAQQKKGQVAGIPGQVLLAWVLSQPKVQGLRIDPETPDAPKDFDRAQVTEALAGLVCPGLRDVLVSDEPTPQRGLSALRAEGSKVLVVQRRSGSGLETMQLEGPAGERILPVFTSQSEVYALGTSLAAEALTPDELRALVADLGIVTLRANPAGPSLDMPANSI